MSPTSATEKKAERQPKKSPQKSPNLTDKACQALKWADDSTNTLYDAQTKGLELRVGKSGVKSWVFKYSRPKPATGRNNWTIGRYHNDEALGVTLGQARQMAHAAAKLVREGVDPATKAKTDKLVAAVEQGNTFGAIWGEVLAQKRREFTPKHCDELEARAKIHILPTLGGLPVTEINGLVVRKALAPLLDAGKHTTLKRCCQLVSMVMEDAVLDKLVDDNPVASLYRRRFKSKDAKPGTMPTLPPAGIVELMTALQSKHLEPVTRQCIEFQLLTLARPGEAAGARWDEIDMEARTWTIPAERMKKRIEHVVHLSEQAMAILEEAKPFCRTREHVFPGLADHDSHIHYSTANIALKRLGFKDRLVAHGLRSLASTTLNEAGFNPAWVEAALAHGLKDAVAAAYNKANYLEPRALMLDWWGRHVERAKAGHFELTPYNVHQLRREVAA
ncbi:tyrosine-type recombinase/integrase [Aeromonas caviae]|uniref:tyrosine-type recombinase/integrase n=1 Tax=Aeromonas caviae TaxID=648 RepID=UPI003F7437E9